MKIAWVCSLALAPCVLGQDPPTSWAVADLDRASAHYLRLGFEELLRRDDHVVLRRGELLTLRLGLEAQPLGATADESAVVVGVDDVAVIAEQLRTAGAAASELVARPSGAKSLRVVDPDGHALIFRSRADARHETLAVPSPDEFAAIVLELARRYPADGTHAYHWPKTGSWKGCTKDLEYGGVVFATGDPKRRAYCCGLTFELFVDAWRLWCARNGRPWRITDFDVDRVKRLQREWFGSADDKSCVHTAIVGNGLGVRIGSLDDALPGDFVQLWRANGSGHSVVFLAWEREGDTGRGAITGIRYWSTQPATKGIGEHIEWFDERGGKARVLREPLWICRVGMASPVAVRRRGASQRPRGGP